MGQTSSAYNNIFVPKKGKANKGTWKRTSGRHTKQAGKTSSVTKQYSGEEIIQMNIDRGLAK